MITRDVEKIFFFHQAIFGMCVGVGVFYNVLTKCCDCVPWWSTLNGPLGMSEIAFLSD